MPKNTTTTTKRPVAASKKAQHVWLQKQNLSRQLPPLTDESLQSQGPLRLLDKAQVCAIANASFPTVWTWMRAGQFPRSRVCGGRSMWLSTEVEAWMAALPVRPLKGDGDEAAA